MSSVRCLRNSGSNLYKRLHSNYPKYSQGNTDRTQRNSSIRQDTSAVRRTSPSATISRYRSAGLSPCTRNCRNPLSDTRSIRCGGRNAHRRDAIANSSSAMRIPSAVKACSLTLKTSTLVYQVLTRLGFKQFEVNINDRKLITGIRTIRWRTDRTTRRTLSLHR